MNNLIKKFIYIVGISVAIIAAGCTDDIDPEITSLEVSRLFSPVELQARIVNQTSVRLEWQAVKNAQHYNIEVHDNATENYTGTPFKTVTGVLIDQLPYIIPGFAGETTYSVRVQALGEGITDSKWTSTTFTTNAEQILSPVDPEEITATGVTIRWPAGETATTITFTPGDITHTVTAGEIAVGVAEISGLASETQYTARLMNGNATRGTVIFTTLIDLGGANPIYPEDNLIEILDAAEEGAAFVIFPGEYILGSYAITKSVKLTGYKPNEKPIIYGQLSCGATVASVELKDLDFRGNEDPAALLGQFFNTASGCNLTTLSIDGCEISHYANNFIYNNAAGTYGTISITNSYVHNIIGAGGDGIDFRGGVISTLMVENTTFANGFRTFLRMQVACDVTFKNCTFYKVANVNNSNNNGLFRMNKPEGRSFSVTNCLFVATGIENPASPQVGNFCRQDSYMVESPVYSRNNIFACHNLLAGLYTSASQISATEIDPGFVNPENGDFTVTNEDIKFHVIGDPRWLQ